MTKWYIIEDVNPQPWAIGPLGVAKKGGKSIPYVGPNKQLVAFQNAVREELGEYLRLEFRDDVQLDFFIWRQIEEYGGNVRRLSGHQADATNIQKALEDALQGVLFANDRQVKCISTTVVEQSRTTKPRILVRIENYVGFDPDRIPPHIWSAINEPPLHSVSDNSWGSREEMF